MPDKISSLSLEAVRYLIDGWIESSKSQNEKHKAKPASTQDIKLIQQALKGVR